MGVSDSGLTSTEVVGLCKERMVGNLDSWHGKAGRNTDEGQLDSSNTYLYILVLDMEEIFGQRRRKGEGRVGTDLP